MFALIQKLLVMLTISLSLFSCSTGGKRDKSVKEKQFDLYFGQGTDNLIKKDYTGALSYLLKAYQISPNHSKLLNNLGMAYYFKRKINLAEKFLMKSIENDKQNSDARNNLASLYLVQGHLNQAKKQYKLILDDLVYKFHYRVHHNIGLIYYRLKKYNLAIKHTRLAIEQKEDYCPANFLLGKIYYQKYSFAKAAKNFHNAQKGLCIKEPLPHWNQALSYIKMKDFRRARNKLKSIIERFSATKFSAMASNKLRKISSLEMVEDKQDLLLKEKYFGKR